VFQVKVFKDKVQKYGSIFSTEVEAKAWVEQQINKGSWGKKEVIMQVSEVVPPMELIEEVEGPMGIKAFKVKLPADYEVKIINLGIDFSKYEGQLRGLIEKKDRILCATDWLFLSDVKVDQKHRRMYMKYREYIRGLHKQIRPGKCVTFEDFEHWLRRNHPEEFMDGGDKEKIISKFMYYIK